MLRNGCGLWVVLVGLSVGCGTSSPEEMAEPSPPSQNPAAKAPQPPGATTPSVRGQLLVDRDKLAEMLDDEQLVVLDTRLEDDYHLGHIPGAIQVDTTAWRAKAHEENGLADRDFWSGVIGQLGIDNQSKVVVYGGRSPTTAARVWWHLRFAGVKQPMLLDGGWGLWKAGAKPVEIEENQATPAAFEPDFQLQQVAGKEEIRAALDQEEPSLAVIDARSLEEYEGRGQQRGGHIPGARHLEWKELLDANGRFKDDEQLKQQFAELGLNEGQTLVTHCQSGGRSSLEVFALLLAGYGDAKNYYRGWSEWAADEQLPVEK